MPSRGFSRCPRADGALCDVCAGKHQLQGLGGGPAPCTFPCSHSKARTISLALLPAAKRSGRRAGGMLRAYLRSCSEDGSADLSERQLPRRDSAPSGAVSRGRARGWEAVGGYTARTLAVRGLDCSEPQRQLQSGGPRAIRGPELIPPWQGGRWAAAALGSEVPCHPSSWLHSARLAGPESAGFAGAPSRGGDHDPG